ncbi:MAG TPA: cysteine synthase family protein [Thermomicrobiales bacterium]|nr:cysteine synthase family protein [Thermomicrobiales bacterium]
MLADFVRLEDTMEVMDQMATLASVLQAIGNTPLVQLGSIVPVGSARVLVKLEGLNPTGSYKDRMALAKIERAERRGDLKPGDTVVEFTGGSTGTSLAFVCAVKGYRFRVVSSDAFSQEKLATMAAFGAEVTVVPSHGRGINADLMGKMRSIVEDMAAQDGVYWTRQFENRDALDGYAVIGDELLAQVEGRIDAFCGGVGTAGMLMGVSRELRAADPRTRIVLLEPASSPVISRGETGSHRIEGVGAGFRPPLLDDGMFDEARGIDEDEARETARRLAREEGIFGGTSSGMNVTGALQLARELGPDAIVVTVICDTGLKYLAGDLFRPDA